MKNPEKILGHEFKQVLNVKKSIGYLSIYREGYQQIKSITVFIESDKVMKILPENLLPGDNR